MSQLLFHPEEEAEKTYSIFVVDDESVICRMLDALLTRAGYRVVTASGLREAVDILDRETFDLVITDLYIDGTGGIDLLKKSKAQDEDVPVILLTGSPDQQYIIDALRNNADDVLIKPVTRNELYFRVKNALEKLHLRRQDKRMKRLIESRETLFSTFMDHLPFQVFINDEQDRLLYANEKHNDYFDSRKNLLKKLEDLFPPEVAAALYRHNDEARQKGMLDYYQMMTTTDGKKRKFRTLLFPLNLGQRKNFLAGIGIDMTDQFVVKEALRDSEDRLAAFIRTIPHGLVENDPEGVVTLCNEGYCRLIGLDAEEILGRRIYDFQPTEEERLERRRLLTRLNREQPEPESFFSRMRCSDGTILQTQVDWNYRRNSAGEVTGYVSAITDITRLFKVEEDLRRSEALLKSIMESPRNINIWSVDRDIRYTFFNYNHKQAMKEYWGADIEIGTRLFDYLTDEDYIAEAKDYYRLVLSGEHMDIMDRIPDTSGRTHIFENYSNPILDGEGNVIGATIFTIDVTGRVKDEERRKQSLKEKEVLLKEIHHRVKNNLQVISSILNMQSDGIDDIEVKKIFIESQNRIRTMSLIHEQLYQNENIAAIRMKNYVHSLVASVVDSMTTLNTSISVDVSAEPIELDIDTAIPVGLILNELVSNSIKYGRGGEGDRLVVSLSRNGENCTLMVRDYGPGISAEAASADRPSLGLKLVEALTTQLNGTFEMKNDNGLVCTLTFPKNQPT